MPPPRPIVILGPTAGGKSDLAVALAERLSGGGEVLGADSMQVYRHMEAGTAKPEPELRGRAPHHLIDIVEPTERFTVHDWLSRAEPLIHDLQARGRTPIIVGGTNLYLKALLEGMFEGPAIDEGFRGSLEPIAAEALHERLTEIDPPAASRIDRNDRKRITRALEVFHLTGNRISDLQTQWSEPRADSSRTPPDSGSVANYRYAPHLIGLQWEPEAINPRINARVKQMFYPAACGVAERESLPDETERLDRAGLLGPQAREALGYKQVLQALRGQMSMPDAFEKTKIETRRFARQQRTWLKRFRGVKWFPAAEMMVEEIAEAAARLTTGS